MSFRDIGAILKKASGELEEKQDVKESLSLSNKAYHLFSKGKTPIQVTITLNLSEEETTKFYQEYWNLKQMHELRMVYEDIGPDIVPFLKLYRLSKDAHMNSRQIINLLQIANNDLPALEQRYQKLQQNVKHLEFKNIDASTKLVDMNDQIQDAKKMLDSFRFSCQKEVSKALELHRQNMELEKLLSGFKNNNKDYIKIQFIAKQTVKSTLSDKRQLLRLALYTLIESWRADPTKFNSLIHGMSTASTSIYSQNSYTENLTEIIVNGAAGLYEKMAKEFTNYALTNAANWTYSNLTSSMIGWDIAGN
jgi:hypothetical protein